VFATELNGSHPYGCMTLLRSLHGACRSVTYLRSLLGARELAALAVNDPLAISFARIAAGSLRRPTGVQARSQAGLEGGPQPKTDRLQRQSRSKACSPRALYVRRCRSFRVSGCQRIGRQSLTPSIHCAIYEQGDKE
jgi:hypothetical protein